MCTHEYIHTYTQIISVHITLHTDHTYIQTIYKYRPCKQVHLHTYIHIIHAYQTYIHIHIHKFLYAQEAHTCMHMPRH
jgi:hypothetical protein